MSEFHTNSGVIHYELLPVQNMAGVATSTEAPTLTLLHNFMSTGRTAWGALLERLTQHYRILLLDLPGHGRSLGHPPSFHYFVMAQQLAALMHEVGADQGHLAGCSAGGMLAQLLVYHRMVTPKTLTLVSTSYSTDPQTTGNARALHVENFIAPAGWLEATARLHDPFQGANYFFATLLPAFQELTTEQTINLSMPQLATISVPVCLIHGEQDEFFPASLAQQMQTTLPDAELHLIPAQTHALLFRRPWVVAETLLDFLERHT